MNRYAIYDVEIKADEPLDVMIWESHYAPTMAYEVRQLREVLACMGLRLNGIDISRVRS